MEIFPPLRGSLNMLQIVRDVFLRHMATAISTVTVLIAVVGPLSWQAVGARTKQVIRIGMVAEPKTLDPDLSFGSVEESYLVNLYEGLTVIDGEMSQAKPGAAASWKAFDHHRRYVFTLWKGLKWSDGTALTAKDFRDTWIRRLAPKTGSALADQLYAIVNAENYNKGVIVDPNLVGLKVLDPEHLEVKLSWPDPHFPERVAYMSFYPKPPQALNSSGEASKQGMRIISNGPFRLSSWRLKHSISMVPNEHYRMREQVLPEELLFLPIADIDTQEKLFLAGKLHITRGVSTHRVGYYMRSKPAGFTFSSYQAASVYYLALNVKRQPLVDVRVRRALSLAIDRDAIVKSVALGTTAAHRFVPEMVPGYFSPKNQPEMPMAAALVQARRLLVEAGFPGGKGMPQMELVYNSHQLHRKVMLAVQDMWQRNLGIKVTLLNQEWSSYLDSLKQRNFSIAKLVWDASYADPEDFLSAFLPTSPSNFAGWQHAGFVDQFFAARQADDSAVRSNLYGKSEQIMLSDHAVIPLFFNSHMRLISDKLISVDSRSQAVLPWQGDHLDRLIYTRAAISEENLIERRQLQSPKK